MVSLIIPCFNHGSTLERAVESALLQSNLCEIIIVDDRSTDNSFEVARALQERHQLVKCIALEKNSGPGVARNLGVSMAVAKYVTFLDADDEFVGDFVGAGLQLMDSNPIIRVSKGDMEFFDPIKGYVLPDFDPRYSAVVLSSACALLMTTADFKKIGGFPTVDIFRGPQGGEDVAFMQMVMKYLAPLGRVTVPLYRVWSTNGSHVDKFLCNTRLTKSGFEFVQGKNSIAESDRVMEAISVYSKEVESRFFD